MCFFKHSLYGLNHLHHSRRFKNHSIIFWSGLIMVAIGLPLVMQSLGALGSFGMGLGGGLGYGVGHRLGFEEVFPAIMSNNWERIRNAVESLVDNLSGLTGQAGSAIGLDFALGNQSSTPTPPTPPSNAQLPITIETGGGQQEEFLPIPTMPSGPPEAVISPFTQTTFTGPTGHVTTKIEDQHKSLVQWIEDNVTDVGTVNSNVGIFENTPISQRLLILSQYRVWFHETYGYWA